MAGKEDPRHRVVVGALIERAGQILCHQRPPGHWGAGKWEFPGGKIDPGEDPREALERECREELAVEVRAGAVLDVQSHTYSDLGPLILLFFWCRLVDESAEPESLEGGAIRWCTREEMQELDWLDADVPLVRGLLAHSK
mgnify:CR=1 FL=1